MSCMCVCWSLSYSTLFQRDLLPHLQSLYSIHTSDYVPECPWKVLGNIRHLREWGYKGLRWGNNLQCRVYCSKFLDFFAVWGEHSVNQGRVPGAWTCNTLAPKHHGFSARVDSTEIVFTGASNFNRAHRGSHFQQSYKVNLRYNFINTL